MQMTVKLVPTVVEDGRKGRELATLGTSVECKMMIAHVILV